MPKNKDLKRLIRARMRKTGESYTTARMRLVGGSESPPDPPEREYATLAGVSDESVEKATGRTWAAWVRALDAVDAVLKPHREIAEHVRREFGISGWWAQAVTVGYERIRGLRDIGQRRDGSYEANKSRTLAVPVETLFDAWSDPSARRSWLGDVEVAIRKQTPPRSMRITWGDGTSVELYFTAKGDNKSQVQIQHRKLPTKADVERVKAFWAGRLDALVDRLASA